MAAIELNLDRAADINITYPIGVKETITFTYNDIVTLTDEYEITITYSDYKEKIFKQITEADVEFTRVDNKLIWVVNYEYGAILENIYFYEIRNITNDYIEFKGTFEATKTIKV